MEIVRLKKSNLENVATQAAEILKKNGLVVIPSDTIYVLAAKATSSKAIRRLLDFKGRKVHKGISVFVYSFDDIYPYAHYDQSQEIRVPECPKI